MRIFGTEPWREIAGVTFIYWDRCLLRLALDEPDGALERFCPAQSHANVREREMPVLLLELLATLLAGGERTSVILARTLLLAGTLLRVETLRLLHHTGQKYGRSRVGATSAVVKPILRTRTWAVARGGGFLPTRHAFACALHVPPKVEVEGSDPSARARFWCGCTEKEAG